MKMTYEEAQMFVKRVESLKELPEREAMDFLRTEYPEIFGGK